VCQCVCGVEARLFPGARRLPSTVLSICVLFPLAFACSLGCSTVAGISARSVWCGRWATPRYSCATGWLASSRRVGRTRRSVTSFFLNAKRNRTLCSPLACAPSWDVSCELYVHCIALRRSDKCASSLTRKSAPDPLISHFDCRTLRCAHWTFIYFSRAQVFQFYVGMTCVAVLLSIALW
jgi:hypothetical protein